MTAVINELSYMNHKIIQLVRYALGLSWIYHGLFPKLLTVAEIERAMTASIGFNAEISYWITKAAGMGEVIFGLLLIIFYKNKHLLWLNIIALSSLLIFVSIQIPAVLIEAFNPVTTNSMMVVLSLILLDNIRKPSASSKP